MWLLGVDMSRETDEQLADSRQALDTKNETLNTLIVARQADDIGKRLETYKTFSGNAQKRNSV